MPRQRVALVTGATGGLGEALCRQLVQAGYRVLAHGRRCGPLEALCADIGAKMFVADLEDVDQIRHLADGVGETCSSVDLVVNNAGLGYGKPGGKRRVSASGFESHLAVNAVAPFLLTSALSTFVARNGVVINVGSTNQRVLVPPDWNFERQFDGASAYQQSKAALIILSLIQAEQLSARSIRLHVVHPGTRLPTRMVFESGTTPLTPLAVGVATVLTAARTRVGSGPMFITPDDKTALSNIADRTVAPSLLAFLKRRLSGFE